MKRVIISATNSCGISATPVVSSDEDRVSYSDEVYEWLATKDVTDADGFITQYSMYRNRETGEYIMIFGDRDIYTPYNESPDYECMNEDEAWEWFDSYQGFEDDEDEDEDDDSVFSATSIEANRDDTYFGETASKKFGEKICTLGKGYTISKSKALAEEPGGLIYEANKLGIDMWDLLEALEGMCADGRATEIDDSTYRINGGQPRPVRSMFHL